MGTGGTSVSCLQFLKGHHVLGAIMQVNKVKFVKSQLTIDWFEKEEHKHVVMPCAVQQLRVFVVV